jgi:hypothetical protein
MTKKVTAERERYLKAFVELRKQYPLQYPTRKTVWEKAGGTKHFLGKEFKDADELFTLGEEYLRKSLPRAEYALLTEQGKSYDPDATADDCIKDLRALQESNPLSFITRTRYRNEGRYTDSVWNAHFGTFKEFRKQAGLELSRPQQSLERNIARQASHDHYREFFSREVLPYCNKYEMKVLPGKIKSMVVASDFHDEEVDEFSLEVFIDTCKRMQPDHIVLNGDLYDLYEFSNFSKDFRKVRLKERFDFVRDRIFKRLRSACPNSQIDFIMGNHEFRLLRVIADQTPHLRVLLSDVLGITFSKLFGLDEFKINWVSKLDLGVFSRKDINDQLKANYKIYYDCFVVTHEPDNGLNLSGTNGHHHKAKLDSFNSPRDGEMTWTQTPGMHVSDAEYLKGMSKWNTGFLIVHINTETREAVQNIIQTHEWAVINGMLYEKKT